jgi:hypothetical protein
MQSIPDRSDFAAMLSVHSGVLATLIRVLLLRGNLQTEDVNEIFDAVLKPYESPQFANDPGAQKIRILADGMAQVILTGRAPPSSPQVG